MSKSDPSMNGSTPRRLPVSNNVVIGAVTVLIAMVAVLFAYGANSGLPFVPTYDINVDSPDASGLQTGDGVMIGGARVGYVGSITAAEEWDGKAYAVFHLKLDKSIEPLPADSTDLVRPVSPLGLKYLQLTRGHSTQMLVQGATIALTHTSLPVEIDDFFDMFTPKARSSSQTDLSTYGVGLAGRGGDLNRALAQVKPLVSDLLPVMQNIMAPQTHWAQFFPSLEQAAHAVVGVANAQAQLFAGLDETFAPLSHATPALQAAIKGGPKALQTATLQLPRETQFIDDTTELFKRLRPGFSNLAQASVDLAPAEQAGTPALLRAPSLNRRLVSTLDALEAFASNQSTLPGLALLTQTAQLVEPTVAYIEPAQTQCNYLALFFRNLENSMSESDSVGTMLRVLAITLPQLPNSEAGPSSAPADGPPASSIKGLSPEQQTLVQDSYLHSDPYPDTAAPGQPDVCEAGNEKYVAGKTVTGTAPVTQDKTEQTKRVLP
jgi:virulence factor Mce-like protein